jgi:hypothetical protein
LEIGQLTARLGAALSGRARADTRTTLSVILTSLDSICGTAVDELVDTSESCSSMAKKTASLEVPGVQPDDVGQTGSMGADERCESCNGSNGGRVMHVEKMRSVRIIGLERYRVRGVSEWIVVVNRRHTEERTLGPERKDGHSTVCELGLRTEGGTERKHHGVRRPDLKECRR